MVTAEKRILVVDDEQIVRDSCQRALTDAGYDVKTAASGCDALDACRVERFDLMLTDLKMPDMDGLEVIRAMAAEFPDVRVVVVTGYPSPESAETASKLGIFDYLEKPLSPERLSAATAAVLARPARKTAILDRAQSIQPEKNDPQEAAQGMKAGTKENPLAKQAVLLALGFLVGVTAAYVIAPAHALAYLAVGTAIASGTILGLFSDALFAKTR
jgi:DNA-binding NtrC family response regulator